jgi:hypothetical protein
VRPTELVERPLDPDRILRHPAPSELRLKFAPQLIPAIAVLRKANRVNDLSFFCGRLAADLPQPSDRLTCA